MAAGPRMVASLVKDTLDAVVAADPDLGRRVREGLRPETLEALRSSSRIAFIPVEIDVELTDRLFELAGRERARAILHDALASTLASPLFGAFIQPALRLRGRDPARLFAWCSKVWNQIYRESGDMCFVPVGDSEGRLEVAGLPPVLCSPTYLDGTAGTVSALFTLLGIDGAAELGAVDAESGHAVITVVWEPRD